MRKSLFLSIVLISVCFGGYSANPRATRGVANTSGNAGNTENTTGAVSARVANRGRAAQPTRTNSATTSTGARVATRSAARSAAPMKKAATTTGKAAGVTAARAGTKQKAINMGTKVAAAAENTMIPKECTDAFYGCMDSLCMLDAASGGRCRCDDRAEQLDAVLDEIMKLNTRNSVLATEGVRRIQMGDGADTVEKWAEDAANKVIANQKKVEKDSISIEGDGKSSSNKLDFSALNNSLFDTDGIFDTDSIFDVSGSSFQTADLTNKRGGSLRSAAMKMCGSKVPNQCKEYAKLLTSTYSAQIQSNCLAYINDLKQQKMNAENQYQEAMKAVRDAASTAYQERNKYKTVGECAIAFKQCMIGEEVCGSGFNKCIIDPMLTEDGKKGASNTRKSVAKSNQIKFDAAILEKLEIEKPKCEHVFKQCEDISKKDSGVNVWNTFLASAAAEIRSAELAAEDDARRNCAKNIVSCIKGIAEGEGLPEDSDLWSMFTQNIQNYRNQCKIVIDKCNAYDTTGTTTTGLTAGIESYIKISLDALRADKCTKTIKKCLTDSCGQDYSGCIGFAVSDLKEFCPYDVIAPDCEGKVPNTLVGRQVGKALNPEGALYAYVNSVAQGLLFNVDDSLMKACINSVNKAMNTYCGDTTSCDLNTNSEYNMDFTALLKDNLNYVITRDYKNDTITNPTLNDVSLLTDSDITCPPRWQAKLDIKNNVSLQMISRADLSSDTNDIFVVEINPSSGTTNVAATDTTNDINIQIMSLKDEISALNTQLKAITDPIKKTEIMLRLAEKTMELGNLNIELEKLNGVDIAKVNNTATQQVVNKLNDYYKHFLNLVLSDPDVDKCINGASYSDFAGKPHQSSINKGTETTTFKRLANNAKSVIAQSVYDRFMQQYNDKLEQIETDMALVNKTISDKYTEAGVQCPVDDTEYAAGGGCKIGQCDKCTSMQKRCACIGRTYFQTVHLKHHDYDNGEVTMLGGTNYSAGNCTITFKRIESCGYKGDSTYGKAATGWNCTNANDMRRVIFALNEQDKIELVEGGCESGQSNAAGKTDWIAYQLKIGDEVSMCFDKCTSYINSTDMYDKDKKRFFDWKNNTFGSYVENESVWCQLRDLEGIDANKPYIKDINTGTDPITGINLTDSKYVFYGDVE